MGTVALSTNYIPDSLRETLRKILRIIQINLILLFLQNRWRFYTSSVGIDNIKHMAEKLDLRTKEIIIKACLQLLGFIKIERDSSVCQIQDLSFGSENKLYHTET